MRNLFEPIYTIFVRSVRSDILEQYQPGKLWYRIKDIRLDITLGLQYLQWSVRNCCDLPPSHTLKFIFDLPYWIDQNSIIFQHDI